MKKTLLFIAAAVAALVSCQTKQETVNENTVPEVKGVPMTLEASFSGATKTTFTPDGSGLKQTWDATESISVVTLSSSGNGGALVSVDTFTSTGAAGRTDATFSGTFTGGETPAFVMAVYPAWEFSGSSYHTPEYNNGSNNILWDARVGSEYCQSDYNELTQTADNNLDHFTNFCLIAGAVNIDDIKLGTLTTTLSNIMSVIKIVATFPDSYKGKALTSLEISGYDSTDNEKGFFCWDSWEWLNIADTPYLSPGSGSNTNNNLLIHCSFDVPDSGVATIYMPCNFGDSKDFAAGDYWNLTAKVNSVNLGPVKKTFTKDVSLTRGKMYTVNVTFTE